MLKDLGRRDFLEEYRTHSMLIGKNVLVMAGTEPFEAVAVDIDENGGLVIELEDGARKVLNSGEVTVRVKKNLDF